MAFISLSLETTDAKSPIDDDLWKKVKDNFDDLNSRVIAAGAKLVPFQAAGKLSQVSDQRRSVDVIFVNDEFLPSRVRWALKRSGLTGNFAFDIRKHTSPNTSIASIAHQYSASTQSIAQTGTPISTQSISRHVAQIATQSITHAKAAKNIQSIVLLGDLDDIGNSLVQYNLNTTVDADTVIGDGIVFAGCSNAANDGTFTIVEKNRSGGNNVVISNGSGVAQAAAAGTGQLKIMSYNFTNPVDPFFGAGFSHLFSGHTAGANNGTFLVYALNSGGNNLWVKNNAGVTQGGAVGAADSNAWRFVFSLAVDTTNYVVGEKAKTSSHSSGGNNAGALEIIAVNSGGNNLVLYNPNGVVQGGIAGTTNTNRWTYAMPSNPNADISVGDNVFLSGHTTPANDGTFAAKQVTTGAVIIYNEAGVAQGGAAGTLATSRKVISFTSDQSAVYSTLSYIEMRGVVDDSYNTFYTRSPFQVVQVNRGGGANFNVVIENAAGAAQPTPSGFIHSEMRSIFNASPSFPAEAIGLQPEENVQGTSTDLIAAAIPAGTPLMLYITEWQGGDPRDLSVFLI